MLEKLIGAKISNVSNDYIEVKKGENRYLLEIVSDGGDCCGYADFTTNLLYHPNDLRNPIITDVTKERGEDSYKETSVITFFGEYKPLATIESEVGSGSGYSYGAYVKLVCKELSIDEYLAEW